MRVAAAQLQQVLGRGPGGPIGGVSHAPSFLPGAVSYSWGRATALLSEEEIRFCHLILTRRE